MRRDLDGHGALDVTGERSPLALAAPLLAVSGTCRPGRDPAALSCGHVSPWDPAAHVGTRGDRCLAVGRQGRDCPPLVPREDVRGRAARAGARQGRDRPPACPGGGEPINPRQFVNGPLAKQVHPGLYRARSDARTAAFVFCTGVLCGSCVAPRHGARLLGGASSILGGRCDGTPTRASGQGSMNVPSIDSVSAAAGALRRLESFVHKVYHYLSFCKPVTLSFSKPVNAQAEVGQ
jgi:hypothetical protein